MLRTFILLLSVCLWSSGAQALQILDDVAPKPKTPPKTQPAPPPPVDREKQAFDACVASSGVGACQAYLDRYRSGRYTKAVRDIIDGRTDKPAPPPPPPQVDPEMKAWNACIGGNAIDGIATCEAYLATYPQGKWSEQASRRVATLKAAEAERKAAAAEKIMLDQCLTGTSPALCDAFVSRYPNSASVPVAKARVTAIADDAARRAAEDKRREEQRLADAKAQAAAKQDEAAFAACRDGSNPADCQAYLDSAPTGNFRNQAQTKISTLAAAGKERAAWDACRNGTTAEPCLAYGREFVGSANAGQAAAIARERAASADAARAEAAAWAQCEPGQSAVQCEKYLALYATGPHAQAAQAIIARINKDEADKRVAEQDAAAWAQCEASTRNPLPCEAYLKAYPAGRFAAAARTRIETLAVGETEDQAVPALGLVVKRNNRGQLEIVSVQGNPTAVGRVFPKDIIVNINKQPYNPRQEPRAALEAAMAAANGRVQVFIQRGAATDTQVLQARR